MTRACSIRTNAHCFTSRKKILPGSFLRVRNAARAPRKKQASERGEPSPSTRVGCLDARPQSGGASRHPTHGGTAAHAGSFCEGSPLVFFFFFPSWFGEFQRRKAGLFGKPSRAARPCVKALLLAPRGREQERRNCVFRSRRHVVSVFRNSTPCPEILAIWHNL